VAKTDDSVDKLDLKRRARRRLIGAIALVVFLIVIPPWLMEGEPRPPVSTLSVEIPSQKAEPLTPTRPDAAAPTAPVAEPSAAPDAKGDAVPAPAAEPASKASGAAATKKEAPATKKDAEPKATKKEAARKSAESEHAPARGDVYVVPVGTYASHENVKQISAKLGAAGVKFYTESVNGGAQTRVRAGPFATREAAEKARSQLHGLGIDAGAVTGRN